MIVTQGKEMGNSSSVSHQPVKLNGDSQKNAATEGGYNKGLTEHIKRRSTAFSDVYEF